MCIVKCISGEDDLGSDTRRNRSKEHDGDEHNTRNKHEQEQDKIYTLSGLSTYHGELSLASPLIIGL